MTIEHLQDELREAKRQEAELAREADELDLKLKEAARAEQRI